ncbi:MAG TPA: cohesin domain-containing protein, partial [Candidatus Paceibacterota bacterium]|nr:cohesin domain-containing protein [Candidatus Paceibacterota bacterium]
MKYFKFFFLILILCPGLALAADLKISVNKSEVAVGELFSARVVVATPDQSANAVSGVLAFNPSKLQVVSLSKTGSVVNLWVTEPDFSNAKGQVNFEGAILNPGFTGGAGTILTVNFKAKEVGSTNLTFADGSVLANDGAGTSILQKLGQAVILVKALAPKLELVPVEDEVTPIVPAKKSGSVPEAPLISSSTHFDETKWYSSSYPKFSWSLPDDVTAVSFVFNDKKNTSAGVESSGLFDDYTVENKVPDGVWYFHLRFKNDKGWGQTTHFAVKIDSLAPNRLEVEEKTLADLNYKTSFVFDGSDELSGLSQYEFVVDDLRPEVILADKAHLYETPALSSGHHVLVVRAVDQAGNKLEKKIDFNIISPLTGVSLYRWGNNLVIILSVLVPLLLLLFTLLYILFVGWRKVA